MMRPYYVYRRTTSATLTAVTSVRRPSLQSSATSSIPCNGAAAPLWTPTRAIRTGTSASSSTTSASSSAVALQASCSSAPHHLSYRGSGAASPALFRSTRIARIPPQLLRFLVAGGAALLQVFLIAFQRESRRIQQEEASGAATGTAEGFATKRKFMSGAEAMQVLGLDRTCASLFSEVQKAESSAAASSSSSVSVLPLKEGTAQEEAKRNFDRMFALAIRDDNLFLAGKLSAAYRLCVNPEWDQMEEVESGSEGENASSPPSTEAKEDGHTKRE